MLLWAAGEFSESPPKIFHGAAGKFSECCCGPGEPRLLVLGGLWFGANGDVSEMIGVRSFPIAGQGCPQQVSANSRARPASIKSPPLRGRFGRGGGVAVTALFDARATDYPALFVSSVPVFSYAGECVLFDKKFACYAPIWLGQVGRSRRKSLRRDASNSEGCECAFPRWRLRCHLQRRFRLGAGASLRPSAS